MTFADVQYKRLFNVVSVGMMVESLSSFAGTTICGHVGGETGLAAVNLAQPVMNIVAFLFSLITTGTAVRFSAEMGGFHLRRARGYFTLGFLLSVGIGVLLLGTLLLGAKTILSFLCKDPALYASAYSYWCGYAWVAAVQPVALFLLNLSYVDGEKTLLYLGTAVFCLLGIPFAYLLATTSLSLAGCAYGIAASYALLSVILAFHFCRKGHALGFSKHFVGLDIMRVCRDSLGDASRFLGRSILFASLTTFVLWKFGSSALAILAIYISIVGFTDLFDAVGNASQPLVGVYVNEHNEVGTRRVMNRVVKTGLGQGVISVLALLLFPGLIARFMGITDPALLTQAIPAVRFAALALMAYSILLPLNAYYPFVNCVALITVVTVAAELVLPAALLVPLSSVFGTNGLWASLGISPLLALVGGAIYLYCRVGRPLFPYLLDREHERKLEVHSLKLTPEGICKLAESIKDLGPRASLLIEEVLMSVFDYNAPRKVIAELTIDRSVANPILTFRDDGAIFNITDADQHIASLRTYLVANLMSVLPDRRNLTTTGYNRNVFKIVK